MTFNLRVDLYLLLSTHSSLHDHKQFVLHARTCMHVLLASSKQHFPHVTVPTHILKNLHLCFVQCLNVDLTFDDSDIHISNVCCGCSRPDSLLDVFVCICSCFIQTWVMQRASIAEC